MGYQLDMRKTRGVLEPLPSIVSQSIAAKLWVEEREEETKLPKKEFIRKQRPKKKFDIQKELS
jgi:hypothetical protein